MDEAASNIAASGDDVLQCVDDQASLHADGEGMAHDPSGENLLERAEI